MHHTLKLKLQLSLLFVLFSGFDVAPLLVSKAQSESCKVHHVTVTHVSTRTTLEAV